MWVVIAIIATIIIVAIIFRIWMRDTIYMYDLADGKTIEVSVTGVKVKPAPDKYSSDGFSYIERYISKLNVEAKQYKSLMIFSPDGNRGMFFSARGSDMEAHFSADVIQEPSNEVKIRDFFTSICIEPASDYLSQNGNVPDSTRCLSYPVSGTDAELTVLANRILEEICDIYPDESLNFQYTE